MTSFFQVTFISISLCLPDFVSDGLQTRCGKSKQLNGYLNENEFFKKGKKIFLILPINQTLFLVIHMLLDKPSQSILWNHYYSLSVPLRKPRLRNQVICFRYTPMLRSWDSERSPWLRSLHGSHYMDSSQSFLAMSFFKNCQTFLFTAYITKIIGIFIFQTCLVIFHFKYRIIIGSHLLYSLKQIPFPTPPRTIMIHCFPCHC